MIEKVVTVCAVAALAISGHTESAARSIQEKTIATVASRAPEQVMWSPSGDSVWVSIVDDLRGLSIVARYPVQGGKEGTATLKTTIRAFWVGPQEQYVATIHEAGRERLLQIWNLDNWTPREVHRDTWNLYFPLVNTVSPWDASGERLLFYAARLHERKLYLWDPPESAVRLIGEGRRLDRAFWSPNGKLLIPHGLTLQQVTGAEGDAIQWLEELDPGSGESRKRSIPTGYKTIFPFPSHGVGILKDPSPPPLILDLVTWKTSPLPRALSRFMEVGWSPEGDWLAYPINGVDLHRIEAFNVKTHESRLLWIGADHMAGSVAYSPSGKYLACSLLEAEAGSQERVMVLDAVTGESIWSVARNPEIGRVYFRRGRKSLLWHPKRDRLLIWDRADREEDGEETEFRLIEIIE